jgi:hypothetical protein
MSAVAGKTPDAVGEIVIGAAGVFSGLASPLSKKASRFGAGLGREEKSRRCSNAESQ